ncbi:putative copper resistance protein [Gordonia hirsuta DSM 44140 = NBRC 16056]|uniref:Putative copper resistance protein n=2 Tax=Gordonia hirsuta TaxID=53427 RepID=L7LFF4_9ACTN|nr:putative copper resistance protein [Gordonia hirsuta DSM 44140 = NBRC 16056]
MGTMIFPVHSSSIRSRLASSLGVIFALVLSALLAGAGVAAAHSAAVGSSPEDGATLDRSPGTVSVTFNEDLRPEYAILKVVGPDDHFWQQGEPTVEGRTISVPVGPLGPVGEYLVNFRVTSADGHPVQGQRRFTLTVAGDGTPGARADAADRENPAGDGGSLVWLWVVLGVVAVLVIAGGAAVALRRRES